MMIDTASKPFTHSLTGAASVSDSRYNPTPIVSQGMKMPGRQPRIYFAAGPSLISCALLQASNMATDWVLSELHFGHNSRCIYPPRPAYLTLQKVLKRLLFESSPKSVYHIRANFIVGIFQSDFLPSKTTPIA